VSRFVRPQTTVLTLSHGDTITIKTRLSWGEQQEAFQRLYLTGTDGKLRVNPLQSGRAMITAYLVDWNLVDDDGAPVPIRGLSVADLESVLDSLDPDSGAEIKAAIEAHERRLAAAREAEKKSQAGASGAAPTSPSPSAAAGASSGSVN
jgi:hypothetical protein